MSYTCAMIIEVFKPLLGRELRPSWCMPCGSTMIPVRLSCYRLNAINDILIYKSNKLYYKGPCYDYKAPILPFNHLEMTFSVIQSNYSSAMASVLIFCYGISTNLLLCHQ